MLKKNSKLKYIKSRLNPRLSPDTPPRDTGFVCVSCLILNSQFDIYKFTNSVFFYPRANTFTHCWAAAFLSVTLWVESERLMHGVNVRLASSHPEAQELKYCGWYNITSLHTKPDADCMWKMQSWLLWNSVEMGKSPRRRKVIYLEDILHVLRLERTRIQSLLFGWSQSMNYLNQRTWCLALVLKFGRISYNLYTNASAKEQSAVHFLLPVKKTKYHP